MNRTNSFIAILALISGAVAAHADDVPATQPAPPALVTKLSAMPVNIWISRDGLSPSKWKFEPERLKWYIAQFPAKVPTYGTDTFTGTVEKVDQSRARDAHGTRNWETNIKTQTYTIDGEQFFFEVSYWTATQPMWSKGDVVTVSGPARFPSYSEVTQCAYMNGEVRRLFVTIHPELGGGEAGGASEAAMRLKYIMSH